MVFVQRLDDLDAGPDCRESSKRHGERDEWLNSAANGSDESRPGGGRGGGAARGRAVEAGALARSRVSGEKQEAVKQTGRPAATQAARRGRTGEVARRPEGPGRSVPLEGAPRSSVAALPAAAWTCELEQRMASRARGRGGQRESGKRANQGLRTSSRLSGPTHPRAAKVST